MAIGGHRLGVDFGTSTTVAVLADPGGPARPLHFDGVELLPSAVCLGPDGVLLAGRDAVFAARTSPGGYEPNPKRAIDDGTVLLNEREVPVVELFAALLSRVAAEARRVAGAEPARTTLTCPAGWGGRRRGTLLGAATAAGLDHVRLVAEPVAAAGYYARQEALPTGGAILVYDLGAGTFDATVVRRTDAGFDILATRGLPDAGGLDIDDALLAHLGEVYSARDPARWRRLTHPETGEDRRAARSLREDVRTAKEILSRTAATFVHMPLYDDEAPLGREQLERLARPVLDRTTATARAALREAGVGPGELAGVFLVGGSTRMPLVATLLHTELGVAPTVLERPELVVAAGSLEAPESAALTALVPEPAREPVPEGVPGPVDGPEPVVVEPEPAGEPVAGPSGAERAAGDRIGAGPPSGSRSGGAGPNRGAARVTAVALVLLLVLVVTAAWIGRHRDGNRGPGTGGSPQATASSSSPGCADLPTTTTAATPTRVERMALSPDGRTLAVAGSDGRVSLWDTVTGRGNAVFAAPGAVGAVAFSPDGRTLAVADSVGGVRLRCVTPGGASRSLVGHSARVTQIAFSRDGRTVATAAADRTIRLWNADTGAAATTLTAAGFDIVAIAVSPDGRAVASSGQLPVGDGSSRAVAETVYSARIWDPATGQAAVLSPYFGRIGALAFSPDGRRLVAGGPRQAVMWDLPTTRGAIILTDAQSFFEALDFSADGQTVVGATTSAAAQQWTAAGKASLPAFNPPVWTGNGEYELVVSHAGQVMVVRHYDVVRIYDLRTGGLRATL